MGMSSSLERPRWFSRAVLIPDIILIFSSEKKRHRTVLEVELVLYRYQDRKSWFVFEVELDGETKISHCCEIKSLSIHCQPEHDSWEMVKVTGAANQIIKLPAVPARDYSNLFCVFNQVSEKLTTAAWDQTGYQPLWWEPRIQAVWKIRQNIWHWLQKTIKKTETILFCFGSRPQRRCARSSRRTNSQTFASERSRWRSELFLVIDIHRNPVSLLNPHT